MLQDEDKLRAQLDKLHTYPTLFLFKFVVPNHQEKVYGITAIFPEAESITYNESKNGKYVAISIKEVVSHTEEVIAKYRLISKIEGVISL
ncbi:MAG: DUF493 family protein [Luteibaculaceae bacterium]